MTEGGLQRTDDTGVVRVCFLLSAFFLQSSGDSTPLAGANAARLQHWVKAPAGNFHSR